MLAGSPLGATEAIMLAYGLTNAMLDALVWDGWRRRNGGKCGQACQEDYATFADRASVIVLTSALGLLVAVQALSRAFGYRKAIADEAENA